MELRSDARRRAALFTALVGLLATFGCAQLPSPTGFPWPLSAPDQTALTEEDLREEVLSYLGSFSAIVSGAADTIDDLDPDPRTRRRTLFWKVRMIPIAQDAALLDDPLRAFAALDAVAVGMRLYLTEGDGRAIFGEHQPIAVDAANRAEAQLNELGARFLSEADLERLNTDTVALMRRRPISGRNFSTVSIAATRTEAQRAGTFNWVTQVPLSPFRALEGVGEGAAAIREFNDTALRFSTIVEGLPDQVRWQSELLLFDVESRDATQRVLAASEALALSANRVTASFEALPDDIARVLEESRGAVADANAALQTAQSLLEPLRQVVSELGAAGSAWERVIRPDEADATAPGRPFDIREWESALTETAAAAAELRALAAELRDLAESEGVEATGVLVGDTVARAESGARDVVDHAAWRGAQLLVGFFVLLAAYRVVTWRIGKRSGD